MEYRTNYTGPPLTGGNSRNIGYYRKHGTASVITKLHLEADSNVKPWIEWSQKYGGGSGDQAFLIKDGADYEEVAQFTENNHNDDELHFGKYALVVDPPWVLGDPEVDMKISITFRNR